jgi:uncharacterized protein
VVPIHDLDMMGRDVQFEITAAWMRGALEGCEMQPAGPDGTLEAHFSKNGNEVLVQGQVDVQLAIPCARCLGRVDLRPHIELSLLLTESVASAAAAASGKRGGRRARAKETSEANDAEDGFASEEADLDTYEGEEVVLDRFVREAILLESPIFPLCSEACEGIRPASDTESPSSEAPTDPRLLPLLELAKRRNMKE